MSNSFNTKFKQGFFTETISLCKKNIGKIITFLIIFAITIFSCFIFSYLKGQKIKEYNGKIFAIMSINDKNSKIEGLNDLINNDSTPQITKNFARLRLIQEYAEVANYQEIKKLNEDLYKQKKDIYIKYLAGFNLLVLANAEKEVNIDNFNKLLKDLKNNKNLFLNLVLEQEILFLINQNKNSEVVKKINELKTKNDLDNNLLKRIGEYLLLLNYEK